jgi:membrane fusion protein, multidrug efflux system
MSFLKLFILFFSFLALMACNSKNADEKKDKPPVRVEVIIAEEENFPTSFEVNGTVLSEEMIELHPEISGRITFLNIPDGATITEGTILAKINDADLQAQLEQQKVQLDLASKTEQRLKKLLAINGIDQATYDAALSSVNSIEANIKVLNAQVDKTVIKAPFTGKLGLRQISLGAYVSPNTLIGTLQQTDKIKIDFTVPAAYENLVNIGNIVSIESTGSAENQTAEITAVEPQINTISRNIKVRARLKSGNIMPGSFVKVSLIENKKGIIVPTNAIIPDALSNQLIVVKNGKGIFTNVETGTRNADQVEITKGIAIGDSIVVSGVLFVRPNAKVKIAKVKEVKNEKAKNKE